jgi:hypothetical protein
VRHTGWRMAGNDDGSWGCQGKLWTSM